MAGYYRDEQRGGYGEEGYEAPGYGRGGGSEYGREDGRRHGSEAGYGGEESEYGGRKHGFEAGQGGYEGRHGSSYGDEGRRQESNYGGGYGSQEGVYQGYEDESGRSEGHRPPSHVVRPAAQTSQVDESQQLFKIFCEANPDYFITLKSSGVVLAPGDESNEHQQFVKDCKWGSRVQDESGSPAFAIINKASGLALKHGTEARDKVTVDRYSPDVLDESLLWTQSDDVGNGYQCIRPVGNIHLNLDANHGDHGAIRSGTELILFKWKKQENQKWKIVPINKTASSYEPYGRPEYNDY